MTPAFDAFRCARLARLVAGLLLSLTGAATAQTGAPLAIAPVHADRALAPVARGFDRWLESAVSSGGRAVTLLPAAGSSALGVAAKSGARQALLPRLAEQYGRVELRLSVYETATGDLLASGRAETP